MKRRVLRKKQRTDSFDYWLLFCIVGLFLMGVAFIFSATMYNEGIEGNNVYSTAIRQFIIGSGGVFLMLVISRINYNYVKRLAPAVMIVSIILLGLVLVIGREVVDSKRWIDLPGFSIQPSEISKIAIIFFCAYYMDKYKEKMDTFVYGILPFVVLAGLVCGLIALEPNLSTATIEGALIIGMMIIGGMNFIWLTPFFGAGVLGIIYMIIKTPWRLERVFAFLNPWDHIQDSGWQICQSLMALGSGKLAGRGFGNGKGKLLFLPEPQNDFIFSHIGEEMGLIFGLFLLAVYLFMVWRCVNIALNAPDDFAILYAGGMAGLLGMQVFINVGVAIGLLPVTGMPLPFVSYGPSSLMALMAGMGVLLNISRHSKISNNL